MKKGKKREKKGKKGKGEKREKKRKKGKKGKGKKGKKSEKREKRVKKGKKREKRKKKGKKKKENMFRSFLLDGWSVWRRMLGKSEVLTLLTASGQSDQSHRPAPMLRSGPTAKNLRKCSREDCDQGIFPSVESTLRK